MHVWDSNIACLNARLSVETNSFTNPIVCTENSQDTNFPPIVRINCSIIWSNNFLMAVTTDSHSENWATASATEDSIAQHCTRVSHLSVTDYTRLASSSFHWASNRLSSSCQCSESVPQATFQIVCGFENGSLVVTTQISILLSLSLSRIFLRRFWLAVNSLEDPDLRLRYVSG